MDQITTGVGGQQKRIRRSVAEKRRIVELTLQPGISVARVAQAEGVNSHQVFQWRRAYRKGELQARDPGGCALLPVVVSATEARGPAGSNAGVAVAAPHRNGLACSSVPAFGGAIHIELSGGVTIRAESGADASLLRSVLESLR